MKTQIFRILDECYKISSHYFQNYEEFAGSPPDRNAYPPELLALPLIGKDELCVYPGIRPSKTIDCVSLECELFKAALPQGAAHKELVLSYFLRDLKSTKDIKDFFTVETPSCCPYYALRSMLLKSHILVTTHTWLLRPELATILHDELNLNPARTAIIIDEVHNFRAHQTGAITFTQMAEATRFVYKHSLENREFLSQLEEHFRKTPLTMVPAPVTAGDWRVDQLHYYLTMFQKQRVPIEEDRAGLRALRALHDFLKTEGDLWYYDKTLTANGQPEKLFVRVLAFPETIFHKVANFQRVILMSGTLFPAQAYQQLYGLAEKFRIIEVPQNTRNIRFVTYQTPGLSSRQRDRTEELFVSLTNLIVNLHSLNPEHTLVFSTSKMFTNNLHKVFMYRYPQLEHFVESTSAQNQIMLDKLRLLKHEIILATMAGSFSEGIEIVDRTTNKSKVSMIVFTGVPVPPPNLSQKLLKHLYLGRFGRRSAAIFLRWLPIYQTLLQAAGRGIRSPTDRCIIVNLDYRIPGLGMFSQDLSTNTDNWGNFGNEIKSFFRTSSP